MQDVTNDPISDEGLDALERVAREIVESPGDANSFNTMVLQAIARLRKAEAAR